MYHQIKLLLCIAQLLLFSGRILRENFTVLGKFSQFKFVNGNCLTAIHSVLLFNCKHFPPLKEWYIPVCILGLGFLWINSQLLISECCYVPDNMTPLHYIPMHTSNHAHSNH
jgi:hypothetical protein